MGGCKVRTVIQIIHYSVRVSNAYLCFSFAAAYAECSTLADDAESNPAAAAHDSVPAAAADDVESMDAASAADDVAASAADDVAATAAMMQFPGILAGYQIPGGGNCTTRCRSVGRRPGLTTSSCCCRSVGRRPSLTTSSCCCHSVGLGPGRGDLDISQGDIEVPISNDITTSAHGSEFITNKSL